MNSSTELIRMPLFNNKEKAQSVTVIAVLICYWDTIVTENLIFIYAINYCNGPLCYCNGPLCKGHTWYMFHLLWLNKSTYILNWSEWTSLFILAIYLLSRKFRFSQQTIQCYLKSYLWYLLLKVLNYISSKE